MDIFELIQSVGFPAAVTIYLLVYMRKEMEKTREILTELKMTIIHLQKYLQH